MYPMVGETFELTLNGDAPENQPLEMLIRFIEKEGCSPKKDAGHRGPLVRGCATSRFKLVQIGSCSTFAEVRRKLITHGEIPEGQWLMAFMNAYPSTDHGGAIGIADASWKIAWGGSFFPSINTFDGSMFFKSIYTDIFLEFEEYWRWLVKVKEEKTNGSSGR